MNRQKTILLILLVLFAVIAAMIWDKVRSDVVALTGAAVWGIKR